MELKSMFAFEYLRQMRSNRTFMELKYEFSEAEDAYKKF